MVRHIMTFVATAILAACTFATNIVARAATFLFERVPMPAMAEPFRLNNEHPCSIFETRRAGMA